MVENIGINTANSISQIEKVNVIIDTMFSHKVEILTQDTLVLDLHAKVKIRYITETGGDMKIESDTSDLVIKKTPNSVIVSAPKTSTESFMNFSSSIIYNCNTDRNVTIYMPINWNLEIDSSGSINIISEVSHRNIGVNSSGSVKLNLIETSDVFISSSGSISVDIRELHGSLIVKNYGSGDISATGSFKFVNLESSGSCRIITNGYCNGNYIIDVSGTGIINHIGDIRGKTTKKCSGMLTCNI